MAHWVGMQDLVILAKNAQTYHNYDAIDKKNKSKTLQF